METWKALELDPKYEVSTEGKVRNAKTHHIYSQRLRKDGYLDLSLIIKGKRKKFLTHRIVAVCYLSNPQNLPEVNHKNKIKTDNRVENLEWVTRKQNMLHRNNDAKTQELMEKNGQQLANWVLKNKAKPVAQYTLEHELVKIFPSLIKAEQETGTNRKYIRACLKGERCSAGGYIWEKIEGSTTIPAGSRV